MDRGNIQPTIKDPNVPPRRACAALRLPARICVNPTRQKLVLLSHSIWNTLYHILRGYASVPNCICFHPSEAAGAIPRWCSISRLCLLRIVCQQKPNAAPAHGADNICEPIIYSVEDLNIPCSVVFKIRCHLVALGGG